MSRRPRPIDAPEYHHLHLLVSLGTRPDVWRRLRVSNLLTLGALHGVIRTAMGWSNRSDHYFDIRSRMYGSPRALGIEDVRDESRARLGRLLRPGDTFSYCYDLSERWRLLIQVEAWSAMLPGDAAALCLEGEGACPPEGYGGPYAYEDMVAALADPRHEQHEMWVGWVGAGHDIHAFDPSHVNQLLAAMSERRQVRLVH